MVTLIFSTQSLDHLMNIVLIVTVYHFYDY
ncbi:MAG: hypothetical protein K0R52_845 [Alphaproteobacteria bacterium]|nr:hypothetical protein [Alphaproteobacteria bacterium]